MSQYDPIDPLDDPDRTGPPLREGRGTAVLVLGIVGFFTCIICGIIAWSMGASDLREMRAGRMSRRQESETRIGMVLGIVTVCLHGIAILIWILVFAGVMVLGAAAVHETKPGGFFDRMETAVEQAQARAELSQVAAAIDQHQTQTGSLPATLVELTKKRGDLPAVLLPSAVRDPWGHEYEYVPEGTSRYRLFSAGPDGKPETADDIAHERLER